MGRIWDSFQEEKDKIRPTNKIGSQTNGGANITNRGGKSQMSYQLHRLNEISL